MEKNSSILVDLDNFLAKFNNTFGDIDRIRTTTTRLRFLQQKSRAVSTYAAEFRLLANDVDWDDNALISVVQ